MALQQSRADRIVIGMTSLPVVAFVLMDSALSLPRRLYAESAERKSRA